MSGTRRIADVTEVDRQLDALGARTLPDGAAPGQDPVLDGLLAWATSVDEGAGAPSAEVDQPQPALARPGSARRLVAGGALVLATFAGSSVAAALTGAQLPLLTPVGTTIVETFPGGEQVMERVADLASDPDGAARGPAGEGLPGGATATPGTTAATTTTTAARTADTSGTVPSGTATRGGLPPVVELQDALASLAGAQGGPSPHATSADAPVPTSVRPQPGAVPTGETRGPVGEGGDRPRPPRAPGATAPPDRVLPGAPTGAEDCRGTGRGLGCADHPTRGNPGQGNPGQGNPGQGTPGQGTPGQRPTPAPRPTAELPAQEPTASEPVTPVPTAEETTPPAPSPAPSPAPPAGGATSAPRAVATAPVPVPPVRVPAEPSSEPSPEGTATAPVPTAGP